MMSERDGDDSRSGGFRSISFFAGLLGLGETPGYEVAAVTLLRVDTSLAQLRGRWHTYEGIPLRATYHPSFLLRQPDMKRAAWQDVQAVMERLGLERAPR